MTGKLWTWTLTVIHNLASYSDANLLALLAHYLIVRASSVARAIPSIAETTDRDIEDIRAEINRRGLAAFESGLCE